MACPFPSWVNLGWFQIQDTPPLSLFSYTTFETSPGRGRLARKALGELLESDARGWVRAVAYQEQSRWLMEKGQSEKALDMLLQAHHEFPDEAAFRVQLMQLRPQGQGLPSGVVASFVDPLLEEI